MRLHQLEVAAEWPMRLLHVPTMTSLKRTGISTYGAFEAPRYNIISYTWGRWRRKTGEGEALAVQGVSWDIPVIKDIHFTVAQFQSVLSSITGVGAGDVDFVWVDVACINQGETPADEVERMDQIGRQAAIFTKAEKVYIWLEPSSTDDLRDSLISLVTETNILTERMMDLDERSPEQRFLYEDQDREHITKSIKAAHEAATALHENPWFTSLWTLQEAALRRDAIFLVHGSKPVMDLVTGQQPMTLTMLGNSNWTLCQELRKVLILDILDGTAEQKLKDLLEQIHKVGTSVTFTKNPNIPFGLARYRATSHPEDRIYGIMQVYGFALGKSSNPDKDFSFSDLELQLSQKLLEEHTVLSQMFIHEQPAAPGFSWRLTQNSSVPWAFTAYYPRSSPENCVIKQLQDRARIKGFSLYLNDALKREWDKKSTISAGISGIRFGGFYLDQSDNLSLKSLRASMPFPDQGSTPLLPRTYPTVMQCGKSITKLLGDDNARIVYIGTRAPHSQWVASAHLALLLQRFKDGEDDSWRRIGIVDLEIHGPLDWEMFDTDLY